MNFPFREEAPHTLPPGLYIVSVPLGNLGDITLRGLETLRAAEAVFCEDTRSTASLCSRYGFKAKKLFSYHDKGGAGQADMLLDLAASAAVALVSDAGTPMISDPGFKAVREAASRGITVIPVPGACAAIAALTVSGLPTDRFIFEGFPPASAGARKRMLETALAQEATMILYESPHRIKATLTDIAAIDAIRPLCVARELTKLHEEILRGTAQEIADILHARERVRGECVIIVSGAGKHAGAGDVAGETEIQEVFAALLKQHKTKDAAAMIAETYGGSVKERYRQALEILQKGRG